MQYFNRNFTTGEVGFSDVCQFDQWRIGVHFKT
jgi:hypothetical protein